SSSPSPNRACLQARSLRVASMTRRAGWENDAGKSYGLAGCFRGCKSLDRKRMHRPREFFLQRCVDLPVPLHGALPLEMARHDPHPEMRLSCDAAEMIARARVARMLAGLVFHGQIR